MIKETICCKDSDLSPSHLKVHAIIIVTFAEKWFSFFTLIINIAGG